MALTVRYPNGAFFTYNNARKLSYRPDFSSWELEDSAGCWVASVQLSSGAIVEAAPPCKVGTNDKEALGTVLDNLESYSGWQDAEKLAELKKRLQQFDAKRRFWKK